MNPFLQVQLWSPSVLLQTALTSQLWELVLHLSIPNETKEKQDEVSLIKRFDIF